MIRSPLRIELHRRTVRTALSRAAAWAVCAVSLLAIPGSASAEPTPEERAQADALFTQARQLMAAKRYATACKMFEESNALAPGRVGTVLNMALCHENDGRTATALTEFRDALHLVQAGQDNDVAKQRQKIATEHIAKLEPKISHVVINVPARMPADLEIRLDNQAVPRPSWGIRLPIDPGPHTVEAVAASRPAWNAVVRVRPDGDVQLVNVPAGNEEQRSPPPIGESSAATRDSGPSTGRALGYVALAFGIGALAVGAVIGDLAIVQSKAGENAKVATFTAVGFIGGGVLAVGAGTVLLVVTPSTTTAMRSPGFAGVAYRAMW